MTVWVSFRYSGFLPHANNIEKVKISIIKKIDHSVCNKQNILCDPFGTGQSLDGTVDYVSAIEVTEIHNTKVTGHYRMQS